MTAEGGCTMDKKDNRSSEREPEGNSFDYEELVNEPAEDQDYEEYREEDDLMRMKRWYSASDHG